MRSIWIEVLNGAPLPALIPDKICPQINFDQLHHETDHRNSKNNPNRAKNPLVPKVPSYDST